MLSSLGAETDVFQWTFNITYFFKALPESLLNYH